MVTATTFAMVAFAGNSLLCRLALRPPSGVATAAPGVACAAQAIDPASFAAIRIAAGALALLAIHAVRTRGLPRGSWVSALALAVYAVLFAFAYVDLDAGTGTLLLFGAVQVTMLGTGIVRGERPARATWLGFAAALAGLGVLLAPAIGTPTAGGLLAMVGAGVAWGVYSLRGRGGADPAAATAGNFALAVPLALCALLWPLARDGVRVETTGVLLAVVSGAVTSGFGYVVWYAALRGLAATTAAIVQLAVPVLAAFGGVLLLDERTTPRLWIAAVLVLGGVAVAITATGRGRAPR